MKVRLLSRANKEIASAAQFYLEEAGARIADRFLDELKAARANIAEASERYYIYRGEIRVARLITFPYSIYFRVKTEEIVVVAVSHDSRRPGYWRDRL